MAVIGRVQFGLNDEVLDVDHDPTVTATKASKGSLIKDSNGTWYRKTDDGSTTNVALFGSASAPLVVTADASGPSAITRGDLNGFALPNGATKGVIVTAKVPSGFNPNLSPKLRFDLVVSAVGAGDGTIDLTLDMKYIGDGELVSKTDDENLTPDGGAPTIVDLLDRIITVVFVLDKTKIAMSDRVSGNLKRDGLSDAYAGEVMVVNQGIVETVGG